MKYRQLGRTGVMISELSLGGMTFGKQQSSGFFDAIQTSEKEAHRVIDHALELGINCIDTSNIYGSGASEEIIGRCIASKRSSVILATKVGGPMSADPNQRGLSRRHVLQACDNSLQRLGTDYIDLYQIHWSDPKTPIDETLRAFEDLVRAGKVRYIGASNIGAYQTMKGLAVSERLGVSRFESLQLQYNLLVRDIEEEIVPMCQQESLGVFVWGPQAQGFLSGKYTREKSPEPNTRFAAWDSIYQRYSTERNWQILEAVKHIAQALDRTPSQTALAWVLSQPTVTSVIVGVKTLEHLQQNLGAADVTFAEEHKKALEEISLPTPRYPFGALKRPD